MIVAAVGVRLEEALGTAEALQSHATLVYGVQL